MTTTHDEDTVLNAPVYLVDDEPAVRDAVAFLLGSRGLQVNSHDGAASVLAELRAQPRPVRGVFLLDIRMEGMSGMRLHEELISLGLRNPVLFLTGHGDVPMAVEALQRGAFDFLEKPYSDNALVDRIEKALKVEAAMQAQGKHQALREARVASLTEREREVMNLVAAGKPNKIIADELGVVIRTVEVHRARVFAKLGVKSAAELATQVAAMRSGPQNLDP
jgi:two-component system response regulator DctR